MNAAGRRSNLSTPLEPERPAGGWVLIERLDTDTAATLVWKDGRPRPWAPLSQLVRGHGISRSTLDRIVAMAFACPPATYREREEQPLFDACVPVRGEVKRLIGHQVVAPTDRVVGVLLWIGPADARPEPRPRSAGLLWDTRTQQVCVSQDTFALRSDEPNRIDLLGADQFFSRVIKFPDLPRVIAMVNATPPHPAPSPLIGNVTLLHDSLDLLNLQVVVKRHGDLVVGAALDISQWEAAEMDPLLAVRSRGLLLTDVCRGVLAFQNIRGHLMPQIVYWVTDPPAAVAYWGDNGPVHREGQDLLHPSDTPALTAARGDIVAGTERVTVSIRLLAKDASWLQFTAALSTYPGSPHLLLVELSR